MSKITYSTEPQNEVFTKITDMKHWQILKLMEEGTQFHTTLNSLEDCKDFRLADESDVTDCRPIFKCEVPDWRSQLDGTLKHAIFCLVWNAGRENAHYAMVTQYNKNKNYPYLVTSNTHWAYAEPVSTKILHQLMTNTVDAIGAFNNNK